MKTVIIIPARYASTRLPGKPLLRETGKYLIQHVYERACEASCAKQVLVATDDPRIEAAVRSFGGDVAMTRRDHASGTDRVAEVARKLDADVIVNLQGDEPLIDPKQIDQVAELLEHYRQADVATLAVPLPTAEQWQNPNCVKVVVGDCGQAIYFSRSPVPHVRDERPDFTRQPYQFFQHMGLYAYRKPFLLQLAAMPPSPLEKLEKLEQLRVLAMGKTIQVGISASASVGIDTRQDYAWFVQRLRRPVRRAA
jgi:3-deoxy-manno-octulosonate cytidylyltransferase (CMP-KDO synthetase)